MYDDDDGLITEVEEALDTFNHSITALEHEYDKILGKAWMKGDPRLLAEVEHRFSKALPPLKKDADLTDASLLRV